MSLALIITMVLGNDVIASQMKILTNSGALLNFPTYDGSGDITHPDILVFPHIWNGYLYWLVGTPYPDRNERFENPSIFVSNDGIKWTVPKGLRNPIAGPPSSGYLSDPDIIYVKAAGLRVYYRWTDGTQDEIFALESKNGKDWSKPLKIILPSSNKIISPSVTLCDSTYYMFSVNLKNDNTTVERRVSQDGLKWSRPKKVKILNGKEKIWHLDVQYVKSRKEFWMLSLCYPSSSLYLAISKDGNTFYTLPIPLLAKSSDSSAWDSFGLYRSTFHITKAGDFFLWYVGMKDNSSRIGFIKSTVSGIASFWKEK